MSSVIPSTHPYWHVRAIVERNEGFINALPASYYTYAPQTIADKRTEFLISTNDFLDESHIAQLLKEVPDGQEMAIHSNVQMNDSSRVHLVMVDMSTTSKAHLEKLRQFLGDNFFQGISWFHSGRSFHGYGDSLLQESDWVKFMGLLLLANMPRLEPTVDPRWIGHRLLAGFAALRWTKNSAHYRNHPSKIDLQLRSAGASIEVGPTGTRIGSTRN